MNRSGGNLREEKSGGSGKDSGTMKVFSGGEGRARVEVWYLGTAGRVRGVAPSETTGSCEHKLRGGGGGRMDVSIFLSSA